MSDHPIDPERDDLVTPRQAAKLLKLNPSVLYRWIFSGTIPAFKRGSRLFLRRADVLAMFRPAETRADRRAETPPPIPTRRERARVAKETEAELRRHGLL